jgi:hypothetical protein
MAASPFARGDILSARFFAPKIININDPVEGRKLGWRKIVRLRVRPGSAAAKHGIATAVILFNFFSRIDQSPFDSESVNTQVMFVTDADEFRRTAATDDPKDALYWLDYGPLSAGGNLSFKLDASFDATDLHASGDGTKSYFVPDGCVACHGENGQRALLNYFDTDHWFDRLDNDFTDLKTRNIPVLVDAGTNDVSSEQFAKAFSTIRQFNLEAEAQAAWAQPSASHLKGARTWLRLHQTSVQHVPPVERSIPGRETWSSEDGELIEALNQYCFRCHGTIRFTVFDKTFVHANAGFMQEHLRPTEGQLKIDPNFRMPSDRVLTSSEVDRLWNLLQKLGER